MNKLPLQSLIGISCLGLFTAFGGPSLAQPAIPTGSLPSEIADAIKNAPLTQTLIPITGDERFNQQIIKANEISFSPGSRLTLTNINAPWIVIAAKTIKFASPTTYSFISRDPTIDSAGRGADGSVGSKGADNPGETGRTGNPGGAGGPGRPGGAGGVLQLPTIYIVVGSFDDPKGPIPPGVLNLVIFDRGVNGGDGGTGGKGGDGGHAGNGKEGATHLFDCGEGGGPGGTGGTAGPGGRGGDAGPGGNGGNIVFVVTQQAYNDLSFFTINNVGGQSGTPGHGGPVGYPGQGGGGANSNGYCQATHSGPSGAYPSPSNLGDGSTAQDGAKGSVTAAIIPVVPQFFGP